MLNPYLPPAPDTLGPTHTRQHREECGVLYFIACLEFSQSLWLQEKPAQAILQLNKAFMADVPSPPHPLPYQALVWFLENRNDEFFIGNPVRHFQHLATRMSGPRSELRSWRAWACFHLAEKILPQGDFPRDDDQISRENLTVPDREDILAALPQEDLSALQVLFNGSGLHKA